MCAKLHVEDIVWQIAHIILQIIFHFFFHILKIALYAIFVCCAYLSTHWTFFSTYYLTYCAYWNQWHIMHTVHKTITYYFAYFVAYFAYYHSVHIWHIAGWHILNIVLHIILHINVHIMHIVYTTYCTYLTYLSTYCQRMLVHTAWSCTYLAYFAYLIMKIICFLCLSPFISTLNWSPIQGPSCSNTTTYIHCHCSCSLQKSQGKSADSPLMSKGIFPVSPTGTRGRRPSMEETGMI